MYFAVSLNLDDEGIVPEIDREEQADITESSQQSKRMEEVMNNGLDFLSGLFKMATGKDVGLEGKKMEIDEKTGEVTIKFKMPV